MAVKGTCSVTIFTNKEIQAVWRYYLLRGSTMSAPAIDDKTVRPPTTDGTEWTAYEPAFSEDTTNSLYFTDCMVFTDGSISYSEVSKSTSYEAAKAAYSKANSAQTAADNAQTTADAAQTEITDMQTEFPNLISEQIEPIESEVNDITEKVSVIDNKADKTALAEALAEAINNTLIGLGFASITNGVLTLGRNTSNYSLKLANDGLRLLNGDDVVAYIVADDTIGSALRVDNSVQSTIKLRTVDGKGSIGLVATSVGNKGHVSLKAVR